MRTTLQSYFVVREMRYVRAAKGSNWLADLDLYLRKSRLRTPGQEVLRTRMKSASSWPDGLHRKMMGPLLARA